MYYFTFTPCPAGRGSSIHRAGTFPQFFAATCAVRFFHPMDARWFFPRFFSRMLLCNCCFGVTE